MGFLDNNLGATFLGTVISAILYGVTSVQTFIYFQHNERDTKLLKLTILLLWILDTTHLAVVVRGMYWYMVTNFGKIIMLAFPHWSLVASVYFTNFSDILVRIVYARRVAILCGAERKRLGMLLAIIIVSLALVVFICGVAFGSYAIELVTFARLNSVSVFLYVSFAAAVAADFIVAISLCLLLFNNRTGIKRTDSMIKILIAFTINTGFLNSCCAIGCFVTYAIWPNDFIFMGFYFPLSKLYLNSLLASLNARPSLRRGADNASDIDGHPVPGTGVVSTQIIFPMHSLGSSGEGSTNLVASRTGNFPKDLEEDKI
ncbi:hypothetical protein CPB83DRAFT_819659 [Crepidotus variabilis]|uniref:DUF6534 domain-containing protein n=1 Tax=Crepidotus variabilis TaxID=179855 RepID=A0A9P6E9A3_9AGAR|nr:hypothetical protein CPB83DRAFT_819659 [Crepidotus variabilis]